MATLVMGYESDNTPVYIDDQIDTADVTCGGKVIWAFNEISGGSVSLQDYAGLAITTGFYKLNEGQLHLTGLVEEYHDPTRPRRSKKVGDKHYSVVRSANDRIQIGSKNYRYCEKSIAEDQPSASSQPSTSQSSIPEPQPSLVPPEQLRQPVQVTPVSPNDACTQLEGDVKRMVEKRAEGKIDVIEINHTPSASEVREDGSVICTGSIITSRGTFTIRFGTSYTPKGQTIIQYNIVDPKSECFYTNLCP